MNKFGSEYPNPAKFYEQGSGAEFSILANLSNASTILVLKLSVMTRREKISALCK